MFLKWIKNILNNIFSLNFIIYIESNKETKIFFFSDLLQLTIK